MSKLANLSVENLLVADASGSYQPANAEQVMAAARSILEQLVCKGSKMTSPEVVKDFLIVQLAKLEHEVFAVMMLDNQHRLIEFTEMFRGSIDSASVHPREVVKAALKCNAAAMILAHNHPSGHPEPSSSDRQITNKLKEALELVEVRVLDHLVVAGGKAVSFAERGLL